jgi:ribonuclease HI
MDARASLTLPGAKLKAMTQATAYKIIRKLKMDKPTTYALLKCQATTVNMALAKGAAADENGNVPPTKKIWKSMFDKDILRSIRYFLCMTIHGGYKVGQYWDNIPSHEWKGKCCNTHESMNHILTKCTVAGQKEVWDLTSEMWHMKTNKEMRPTMGQIMAGGVTKVGNTGEN